MLTMTDGIAWLAARQSIAFGGYSVVMARGLVVEELVSRLAATVHGPSRTAVALGNLTGDDLIDVLEQEYGGGFDEIAMRYGEAGEWAFVVLYGGWQGELGNLQPVSREGAHVFHAEFEEENGKPVPPFFAYSHDERLMCAFNLHLDGSWGYDGVQGAPEVAAGVQQMLADVGLPDAEKHRSEVHRTSLHVLEQRFGLTLPRMRIQAMPLHAIVLEIE
jgi:hypothetical protein